MSAVYPPAALDFDADALDAWLKDWLGGEARTEARRTEGGMSNPTYFLQRGDWRAVLRKQPRAALAPSAHAIDREFRVLEALQDTAVPVPKPIRYCADRDILGTPFYLMEWLDGRVFHEFATPSVTPEERAALYRSMCATLAEIHKLDFRALGLADYGKPGNYFRRQLSRWARLWSEYRKGDDDNPGLDLMVRWLDERVPESETTTLCHGDLYANSSIFNS